MSPSKLHNSNKDLSNSSDTTTITNHGYNWVPPPLKINKNSHSIRKSSPSPPSSSSSSSSLANNVLSKSPAPPPPPQPPPQQRHPVIIYTHSPKVIHTHPKDFMALVQKLTGLTRGEGEENPKKSRDKMPASSTMPSPVEGEKVKILKGVAEDNESSSVVTEENGMSSSCSDTNNVMRDNHMGGQMMINSCYMHQNHCDNLMNGISVFGSNSGDLFCPNNQPFYNYNDAFLFGGPTSSGMRSHHVASSSLLEGMNELRKF